MLRQLVCCGCSSLPCRLSCVGGNGERFLFDPVWREQWQVLNQSEGYAHLLASLPEAFCGSEQRLVAAVQLLCREVEAE